MLASSGCAGGGSDLDGHVLCPPVMEYTPELQARAADELDLLPEGSAIAQMLMDYAVMQEQTRVCRWNQLYGMHKRAVRPDRHDLIRGSFGEQWCACLRGDRTLAAGDGGVLSEEPGLRQGCGLVSVGA